MEPTQGEITNFYNAISNCGTKPAILSLIPGYSDAYIPKERRGILPAPLTSLFKESNLELQLEELREQARGVTLEISTEMIETVKKETIGQSGSKLWYRQRAGRITASQLKSALQTNPMSRSRSLVKRICYPEAHKFTTEATRLINN